MYVTLIVLFLTNYLIGSLSADMFFEEVQKIGFVQKLHQSLLGLYPFITKAEVFSNIVFEFASGCLIALIALHFLSTPLYILGACFAGIIGQVFPLFKSKYDNCFPIFAGTLAILFGWFFALLLIAMWIFIRRESNMTFFTHLAVTALVPFLTLITGQPLLSFGYTILVTALIFLTRIGQIRDMIAGKNNELILNA